MSLPYAYLLAPNAAYKLRAFFILFRKRRKSITITTSSLGFSLSLPPLYLFVSNTSRYHRLRRASFFLFLFWCCEFLYRRFSFWLYEICSIGASFSDRIFLCSVWIIVVYADLWLFSVSLGKYLFLFEFNPRYGLFCIDRLNGLIFAIDKFHLCFYLDFSLGFWFYLFRKFLEASQLLRDAC